MRGAVIRRVPRALPGPIVVVVPASPPAGVTLVCRGWLDLRGDVVAEMRRFGRTDATSVDDLLVERRAS